METKTLDGRFVDTLDPAHVALLDMAVDQIEAAPERFSMKHGASGSEFNCDTTLCIGGHMAILAHPEWLRGGSLSRQVSFWMYELYKKNPGWDNLFHDFTLNDGRSITPENVRERVEEWKQSGN